MNPWKTAALQSIFSVEMPTPVQQSSPSPRTSKVVRPRNRKPCGRCSDKQKKCDISPPYSSTRCGACAKANIQVCPPHKARRSSDNKQRTARRADSSEQDKSLSTGSRPIVSQSQSSGIDTGSGLVQYQTVETKSKEGETQPSVQYLEASGLGLAPTDVLITSQAGPPANNGSVFDDFEQAVFNGGLDSSLSLLPGNAFFSHSEDVANDANFAFSTTFIPAFLSSL